MAVNKFDGDAGAVYGTITPACWGKANMAATASVLVSSRQHRATWQAPGRLHVALALTGDCRTTCFADKFPEIIFPRL